MPLPAATTVASIAKTSSNSLTAGALKFTIGIGANREGTTAQRLRDILGIVISQPGQRQTRGSVSSITAGTGAKDKKRSHIPHSIVEKLHEKAPTRTFEIFSLHFIWFCSRARRLIATIPDLSGPLIVSRDVV